jgi:hypothetical protein
VQSRSARCRASASEDPVPEPVPARNSALGFELSATHVHAKACEEASASRPAATIADAKCFFIFFLFHAEGPMRLRCCPVARRVNITIA